MAGDHDTALQLAAQAMHTIEDCSSPMHIDSHGNPYEWNPINPLDFFSNNAWHSPGNHWGGETPNELTPAILDSERQELLKDYKFVFGGCTVGRSC